MQRSRPTSQNLHQSQRFQTTPSVVSNARQLSTTAIRQRQSTPQQSMQRSLPASLSHTAAGISRASVNQPQRSIVTRSKISPVSTQNSLNATLNSAGLVNTTTIRMMSGASTPGLTDVALVSPRARSYRKYIADDSVTVDRIHKAYLDARWGPSAFNCSPLRYAVLTNRAAKEKFAPALAESNVPVQLASPFTLIFAYDLDFVSKMDKLSPNYDGGKKYYLSAPESIESAAQLNAHLQAGYFLLSLRANGLDIGPASGFDPKKTDEIFFGADTPYKNWRSFMYVNVGHGDESGLFPRDPRLDIEDVTAVF